MATEQTTTSIFKNVAAGLDHFDPFQGFVDEGKGLNLRFGFKIGEINLLLNKSTMSEVIKDATIYPLPNTPPWIQGILNLRGILVPVFNLKKHIEQNNSSKSKRDTLLVIDKGERAFAVYIDELPNSIDLDNEDFIKSEIPPNIPQILKNYTDEAFSLGEEIWLDIDYDAFIKDITHEFSTNN